jgi:hypothetical protein
LDEFNEFSVTLKRKSNDPKRKNRRLVKQDTYKDQPETDKFSSADHSPHANRKADNATMLESQNLSFNSGHNADLENLNASSK